MATIPLASWKDQIDFKSSAQREFLRLPPEIRDRFFGVFEELSRHPEMATPTLDVNRVRNHPSYWRLKVAGDYRGVYKVVRGRPTFILFETRDQVYESLRRFLGSGR